VDVVLDALMNYPINGKVAGSTGPYNEQPNAPIDKVVVMNNIFKSLSGKYKVLNDDCKVELETTLSEYAKSLDCICKNEKVSGDFNYSLCTMAIVLHKMIDKLKEGLGTNDPKISSVGNAEVTEVQWSAGPIKVSSDVVDNIGKDLFKVTSTKNSE
jgi:hypothetical protein